MSLTRALSIVLTLAMVLTGCRDAAREAAAPSGEAASEAAELVASYVDATLAMYPTRATGEGDHSRDGELESFTPERLTAWVARSRETADRAERLSAAPTTSFDDRLDLELTARAARVQVLALETERRPQTDPLFWTRVAGNAVVFLLVRDDRPLDERLGAVVARARAMPRFVGEARAALGASEPSDVAPEIARIAARQAAASATFFGEGLPAVVERESPWRDRLEEAGGEASTALSGFAVFLEELAESATGSPRLGPEAYAERFLRVTGIDTPVPELRARAVEALTAQRAETAAYGRRVWAEIFPGEAPPNAERELLDRLLARAAEDRASGIDDYVADFDALVAGAIAFVRERGAMTLPDPFPVEVRRSPPFFVGQSVGGVYSPGPWASHEPTILFVPTPPADATPEALAAFFRDFNHHFNVMITPHEIVPGHATQLVLAARHPRRARALFADGVFVEGWGTFCERLMLDLGWGGPLDRVAHLKKQMENIARTIVDIDVHAGAVSREEVIALVRGEALQDEQFASNMWTRAITSSPQLTYYFQGYEQVHGLYEEVRAARGEDFDLAGFMDGMMALGPVPIHRYRERFLVE